MDLLLLLKCLRKKGNEVSSFECSEFLINTTWLSDGKGGASDKVMEKESAEIEHVVSAPKFKQRKVSVVRDILPGCGRETAPNFGLSRQIPVDQSSQGKW
ncbi:hypothetical protein J1N35_025332 [Gossypium stocksii]|uniref:Uncharacterized protein n=1 Tax=Gossypium stocksii TaxID=47602 RepID=A0A9D3V6C5_9ROSI|nr:hypothetical protein J1N35_025332 [Gossypium stocksii]